MPTLLLRLSGPMQSWGISSRFDERDTGLEPSKSGVIGLLCAALGRDRAEPLDDLAALRMGVRVDKEGVPRREFQTATGVALASGKVDKGRTVVSPRYYLADALFLVGLEGQDTALLRQLDAALGAPVWPLYLGRKSFVPGEPVRLMDGLADLPLLDALRLRPRLCTRKDGNQNANLRFVLEDPSEGSVRMDQPVGPFAERRFGSRFIRTEAHDVPVQDQP